MKLKSLVIAPVALVLLFSQCKKKDKETPPEPEPLPKVTTAPISWITDNTAKSGGEVTYPGTLAMLAVGVCWDTQPNPTTLRPHTDNGAGTGTYESTLTGLLPNTTYYVRAYATNLNGTSYGNQISFKTQGAWEKRTPDGTFDIFEYGMLKSTETTIYALKASSGSYKKSTDYGLNWVDSDINIFSSLILFENKFLCAGFTMIGGNGLYGTSDNGNTWLKYNTGFPYVNDFAVAKNSFFASYYNGTVTAVKTSLDKGASWTELNNLPTDLSTASAVKLFGTNTTLFAHNGYKLYSSTDGGNSFTFRTTFSHFVIKMLSNGSSLFVLLNDDMVYRSDDNGNNWAPVNAGLVPPKVMSLVVDGNTLYAATWGGGVYRLDGNSNFWIGINGASLENYYVRSMTKAGAYLIINCQNDKTYRKEL